MTSSPVVAGGRRIQHVSTIFTCCSIAMNAICAGGIFTFPLVSPALALHSKFTQPQLTTIVLAGMMSQYPFAAVAGKVIDHRGPSMSSLIGAMLFSWGFGAFAWEVRNAPTTVGNTSLSSFHRLTFFYFLAGLGTVFSYFSSLFAASRIFPRHLGIASGSVMAIFGLSPLFLSFIASTLFTERDSGLLNVSQFMAFLAILAGSVNVFGAAVLRKIPYTGEQTVTPCSEPELDSVNENTSLLEPTKCVSTEVNPSTLQLIRDPNFWLLAVFCVFILGASEMVISNIGTIVLSLPPSSSLGRIAVVTDTTRQVRLLSMSNTVGRIVIGPLADFLSPMASPLPSEVAVLTRKRKVSRMVFLTGSCVLLASTFTWMEYGVRSRDTIWVLSVGTGLGYSAIFTVLPSIISSVWGTRNLGRNFGIMMYAPFAGTPMFSYLYAFVSEAHSGGEGICVGIVCWQLTFWVGVGTSVISLCISAVLWRQWMDRV